MRVHWTSMVVGAVVGAATVVAAAAFFLFVAAPGGGREPRHRTLTLPSGRTVEVTALNLAFGDEHSQRGAVDDGIGIQYVSAAAGDARDKEAAEVFEAIRPLSESLGLLTGEVRVDASLSGKGGRGIYGYSRALAGAWSFKTIEQR